MKALLTITLSLFSFLINAQDTICFKNKAIIPAKIIEVGISEIKYLRHDNLTGLTYTSSKKDIQRLKYSNGRTDTILFTEQKEKEIRTITSGKQMMLVGTDIYYNNKMLGEFAMRRLITTHAASENQVKLIKDVKKLKIHERSYNALGTGLFATGFAVPVVVTLGALSASSNSSGQTNAVETIVAGAVAGALLRISGHVVMKIGKNKTKAKKLEFLKRYNQNEIIY